MIIYGPISFLYVLHSYVKNTQRTGLPIFPNEPPPRLRCDLFFELFHRTRGVDANRYLRFT